MDLGIGHGYKEVVKGFAKGNIIDNRFTRVVRGETITMTFAFETISLSIASKIDNGIFDDW